jgi:hypothetical protein
MTSHFTYLQSFTPKTPVSGSHPAAKTIPSESNCQSDTFETTQIHLLTITTEQYRAHLSTASYGKGKLNECLKD